ncbi:MAG: hypothetical protein Q7S20_13375 [Gemmatimonadaceae bacterium]|nr:hypothetical protein [Gemmatimonadaceae bacterium]
MRSSAAINRILLDGLVRLGVSASEAPPAATLTAPRFATRPPGV